MGMAFMLRKYINAGCFTNSSRITVPNFTLNNSPHTSIIETFENNLLQPTLPKQKYLK